MRIGFIHEFDHLRLKQIYLLCSFYGNLHELSKGEEAVVRKGHRGCVSLLCLTAKVRCAGVFCEEKLEPLLSYLAWDSFLKVETYHVVELGLLE